MFCSPETVNPVDNIYARKIPRGRLCKSVNRLGGREHEVPAVVGYQVRETRVAAMS